MLEKPTLTRKQQRTAAFERTIRRLDGRLQRLQQTSEQLSLARLILFLLGLVASGAVLLSAGPIPWLWATPLALAPFVISVAVHRRIETALRRFSVWRAIKQAHLARMALDWAQLPPPQLAPPRFNHPFALDVDLIGDRSLHQLLDTAVSQEGSDRLRAWLLDTDPQLARSRQRQAQVRELCAMPRFRDKLTLHATLVTDREGKWPGQKMLDWLQAAKPAAAMRPLLAGMAALAAVNLVLFGLDMAGVIGSWWLLTWGVYAVLFMTRAGDEIGALFQDATFLSDGLHTLNGVFGFLETVRFGRRRQIRAVCAPIVDAAERPSQAMRRVSRVVAGVGVRQNPFIGILINLVVPWDLYIAYRLRQCQNDLAAVMPAWLDAWFELEALGSLANYAFLNPGLTTFPTLTDAATGSLFRAEQIGHPLIPDAQRVCNDFAVAEVGSVTLITGSNMSGKSSFLRTLGMSLALAYAGGPALAQALHTTVFRLYSSIRVTDSVTDGFSYFYAEVQRLRGLLHALQAADERPLFFLIDEIFRGTNNRERLIGSRATIRAMVNGYGIGVIATHDLELVKLADENAAIRNMHFRDDVQDGQMVFDYTLRPGPCPTTNALRIMRLAGLPVPENNT